MHSPSRVRDAGSHERIDQIFVSADRDRGCGATPSTRAGLHRSACQNPRGTDACHAPTARSTRSLPPTRDNRGRTDRRRAHAPRSLRSGARQRRPLQSKTEWTSELWNPFLFPFRAGGPAAFLRDAPPETPGCSPRLPLSSRLQENLGNPADQRGRQASCWFRTGTGTTFCTKVRLISLAIGALAALGRFFLTMFGSTTEPPRKPAIALLLVGRARSSAGGFSRSGRRP